MKELNLECDMLPTERALGVSRFVETDAFGFKVHIREKPLPDVGFSRSLVQSTIRSAWQHLSFSQQSFSFSLGWDDDISNLHLSRWQAWFADLPKLSQLSVNTCVKGAHLGKVVTTEIHHLCDASQCAYGAVSYLRQVDSDGQANCSFLVGKSRLAPCPSRNCVSSLEHAVEE